MNNDPIWLNAKQLKFSFVGVSFFFFFLKFHWQISSFLLQINMNQNIFVVYSLIYTIITFCFVYKTDLFISVGLTVENLFESYLGREQDNFVNYHIKKSCITTILHLSLPFGNLSIFLYSLHSFNLFQFLSLDNNILHVDILWIVNW